MKEIELNGKRYVTNLSWIVLDDKPIKPEILGYIEENDAAGAYLVPADNDLRYMLGVAQEAPPKKTSLLTTEIIRRINKNDLPWMGVFDLGGGSSYILALGKGGVIFPDTDVITDNDVDTEMVTDRYIDVDHINVVNGTKDDLAELLESKPDHPIHKISYLSEGSGAGLKLLTTAALIAILGAGGVYAYQQFFSSPTIAPAPQQAQFDPKPQGDAEGPPKIVTLKYPTVSALSQACVSAAKELPRLKNGWQLVSIECTPRSLQGQYQAFSLVATPLEGLSVNESELRMSANLAPEMGGNGVMSGKMTIRIDPDMTERPKDEVIADTNKALKKMPWVRLPGTRADIGTRGLATISSTVNPLGNAGLMELIGDLPADRMTIPVGSNNLGSPEEWTVKVKTN